MNAQPEAGVVVVGSGLGGYTLARELRKQDPAIAITVVTADGGEMYAKPMLSNALAQGKDAAALTQKSADQVAAELNLTIHRRQRVVAIDRARHVITVAGTGGRRDLAFDKLVLAIGADPRPYWVDGADMVKVHAVNDLDDYAEWRGRLCSGSRVLLIGAGLIGAEFANDLALGGFQVTVVDPAPWPLGRLAPQAVGDALAAALRGAGIVLHLGRNVSHIEPGRATLDDGTQVGFDLALSAIGLSPRVDLARSQGLAVDRGIVVDRFLRTSEADIYAIGDCAQTPAGLLPFVLPLMAQARAVAATLAGKETALVLPAMPVVVKTPALPVVVCPPPQGVTGEWRVEGTAPDLKALYVDGDGVAQGFALTGRFVGERQALGKTMPAVLAEKGGPAMPGAQDRSR